MEDEVISGGHLRGPTHGRMNFSIAGVYLKVGDLEPLEDKVHYAEEPFAQDEALD